MRPILFPLLLLLSACVDTKRADLDAWTFHSKLNGGMRVERTPLDAPVDRDLLIRNFRKIAYDVEADPFGTGELGGSPDERPMLKRWEQPVRLHIVLSDGVPDHDRLDAPAFMRKLAGLADFELEIVRDLTPRSQSESHPNFIVFMGEGDFFDETIAGLQYLMESGSADDLEVLDSLLSFLRVWHDSYSPCAGQSYTAHDGETDTGVIFFSIVAIRTDLADPMTQSCIEEELAQSLGLMNDDSSVRPSLFNDDNEFALMTTHDELLLRILYDARLSAGMTPEQSMPIVRKIAGELLSDG